MEIMIKKQGSVALSGFALQIILQVRRLFMMLLYTQTVIFAYVLFQIKTWPQKLEQVSRGSRIPPASVTALYIK